MSARAILDLASVGLATVWCPLPRSIELMPFKFSNAEGSTYDFVIVTVARPSAGAPTERARRTVLRKAETSRHSWSRDNLIAILANAFLDMLPDLLFR